MSTLTTNLGLVKPSGNERPQVSVINANMDVLDAVIGDPSNLRSGSDITSDIKALRDSVSRITYNSTVESVRFSVNGSGDSLKPAIQVNMTNGDIWWFVMSTAIKTG